MKISVIVATRDKPEGAHTVLAAAKMLASGKHEIDYQVAIDDDDYESVVHQFPFYVTTNIAPRPLGPGECWNRCVATARGDVMVQLCDDDLPTTLDWDDVIATNLNGVAENIAVLAWHKTASPNQPTTIVAHREWIKRAGFMDNRFPFWFADTAVAETYSFITGHGIPMPQSLVVTGQRPGDSNPRMRDMKLWWDLFAITRQERIETATKMREELGLPIPFNFTETLRAWRNRDAQGLPMSEEIVRNLKNPKAPDAHYLKAKENAEKYLAEHPPVVIDESKRYTIPRSNTICLAMIVKNEADVIRRCLDSVSPLIDRWVIVDTGSTDGTQDIIREHMKAKDIPGELVERPWKNFADNRSESLALARATGADYTTVIDADDTLEIPEGLVLNSLVHDSYIFNIKLGGTHYTRVQLVSNKHDWKYRGVVHEFITCPGTGAPGTLPMTILCGMDGKRRKDPTETYRSDAAALEMALIGETDEMLRSRYMFYLAQSYRDCKEFEKALGRYMERAEMGQWIEEVYNSLLNAGRIMANTDKPVEDTISVMRRAATLLPLRAEAWHDLCRYLRFHGRNQEAFDAAAHAVHLTAPAGALFVESWIYDFALLDEYSVAAYHCGRFSESASACQRILRDNRFPGTHRERIQNNLRFALDKLGERKAA